jgi:potassium large conductance calcium-activated channel subfamily M alpha protein 1
MKFAQMGGGDEVDIENIDGEWLNICQATTNPISLEDITFTCMKDTMLAENHIIVCGMVENIKYLVMPLRAGYNSDPSPIVILHDELPTAKQWAELNTFS